MDKKVPSDYIDASKFIKEIEVDIKKLEKKQWIMKDKVKGSNSEFSYEEMSFGLHGTTETLVEVGRLARERQSLEEQKTEAEELKLQAEEWM